LKLGIEGGVFAVLEQPDSLFKANTFVAVSLSIPNDEGTSVARLAFS